MVEPLYIADVTDPTARAILAQIRSLGYVVRIADDGERWTMTAVHFDQTHKASGEDEYDVACALAESVGIDLMDG